MDGLSNALNSKHPLLTAQAPLSQSLVSGLTDALNSKQNLLSDVSGTGVSLLLGTHLVRKLFGHGGIACTQHLELGDPDDPRNFQIRVSGEALQTALAAVQQKVGAVSTDAFVPNPDLTTYIAGNVNVASLKIHHALLCPILLAPAENVNLSIRTYGNSGGLTVENTTGKVSFASGITMGGGSFAEISTNGVRALTTTHDVGQNYVCGTTTVLSLSAATGAYVTGALGISNNCTIDGQLVVGSTNILQA